MRKRILAIITLLIVLSVLAGCGHQKESITKESTGEISSQETTKAAESGTKAETTKAESEESTAAETTEEQKKPETTKSADTTKPAETTNQADTTKTAETTIPQTEPAKPTHTHSYSAATCTKPATCSCGATSGSALGHRFSDATCTKAPTCTRCGATSGSALGHSYSNGKCTKCGVSNPNYKEPALAFDINYWVTYAKNYAESVGLILNPDAVECWDNPTDADAKCIYLERDLSGRLNRYAKDKDITDVWIWYEDLGNGNYLIYIGYA